MLQVAVHKDAGISLSALKPCEDSALLAEVAAEIDSCYPVILFRHSGEFIPCCVGRAVIDEHKLEIYTIFFHYPRNYLGGMFDITFLVIARDHY